MKRSRTKNEITQTSVSDEKYHIRGYFGSWKTINKNTRRDLEVNWIKNKVKQDIKQVHIFQSNQLLFYQEKLDL